MDIGKRAAVIYVAMILMFTGLISRCYALSMRDTLTSAASRQSAFVLPVDKTRGMIYDRALRPLVARETRAVAAVQPIPEAMTALATVANEKDSGFAFNPEAKSPYLLSLGENEVYSRGVEMFDAVQRYGEDQLASHIIGYLNPEKDTGVAGIEMACDTLLSQHSGNLSVRYAMDAAGRPLAGAPAQITRDNYKDPGGVALTLDINIQRAAERAMRGVEKGAAVVMDVQTGDILASVSVPEYDPNDLAKSLKDPDSPFVNRAFSQYNVGSTFKLVTAAAALENGFGRYAPYKCVGVIEVDKHLFYCHWRSGHGEIDLQKAIEISCNPFFIDWSLQVGGKRIVSLARDIGFSRAAVFADDIKTQSGTLPPDSELALATGVANLAFGQGSLTATPIQVAQMICTVANGGYAVTPRLIEGYTDDGKSFYEHTPSYGVNRVFSKYTSDVLRECMVGNVIDGSGVKAKPYRCGAGGKTASAQTGIYTVPGEEDSEIVHAWFAGYFPDDDPKYAVAVLVEGGKSGSDAAAPIFKSIADDVMITNQT